MIHKTCSQVSILVLFVFVAAFAQNGFGQIPNQLAADFVAGTVPAPEEVAKFEKDVAANPDDLRLTRKLGKAYFFQFFGEGDADAAPKAQKTLERALVLQKDDAETLAYLGALHVFSARRLRKQDAVRQKTGFDRGLELLKQAEKVGPRNGAVISIASASYMILPDSYSMAPHVVEMLEGLRKGMGPMFGRFAHHGQQRLLLTLGQAYAKTGQNEKARATFDEALKVNGTSVEAGLLRNELDKLKN